MDERRIFSSSRQSPAEVSRVSFSTVRKGGFDPDEVRQHLEGVGRDVARLESRISELQEQLSKARREAQNPTLDEATLLSALGAQSAAILRAAHEEAARVTSEVQERSAKLFAESQEKSAEHLIEAQERSMHLISEAESTASQIEADARLAAERLIDSAKLNGEALVDRAREQGRAILEQANEARKAQLNDLAVKRKALQLQIEQLRAARDTLGEFVGSVRDQVENVLDGINGSDEIARAKALEVLRQRPSLPEPTEEELLAGTPLRAVPDIKLLEAPDVSSVTKARPRKSAPKAETARTETMPAGEEGTDVVNEIFARLRKATLEERGATAPPKKSAPAPAKPQTQVGELFARRDDAIDESLAVLTRKVKRALQDDQNITLERLRDTKGDVSELLEDEKEQRARYADAAFDALVDASAAGSDFASAEAGANGGAADKAALRDCAADLAVTIVVALRRRIIADGSEDGQERANSAYKEWRGARVERLCTDAARRAFHLGVLAASKGRSVRFYAAPNDAPCDACTVDAAAGERPAGSIFPSGSAYPPLHAGCACTVLTV